MFMSEAERVKGHTELVWFFPRVIVGLSTMKSPSTTGTNVKTPKRSLSAMLKPIWLSSDASTERRQSSEESEVAHLVKTVSTELRMIGGYKRTQPSGTGSPR